MRRGSLLRLTFAASALLAMAVSPGTGAEPVAGQEVSAAQVMQSVFANRLRDGGYWRQDNPNFRDGADAPKYWMQVWRDGPGGEVVIVDAYAVKADNTCSAMIHIVYTYDRKSGRIHSRGFGANGISGHGVVEFDGTVTSTETTIQLPNGQEVRMRDREDQGAPEAVTIEAETWDGKDWTPDQSVTWRRSAKGLPCSGEGAAGGER